jgi:peptide chain release factor 3
VYNIFDGSLNLFNANKTKIEEDILTIESLNDPLLEEIVGKKDADQLRQDIELIEGVFDPFDPIRFREGHIAPVFFGSAINNFGVRELLDTFIRLAPAPRSREADTRIISPDENKFSGFVFKIHANIDPRHRDRIAFLRVCSGKFERNKFFHHVRLNKDYKFSSPATFMAQEKNIIDEAWPGDVIGLYDTGNFKIGDTLTEGENFQFRGIPSFSPEIFKEVVNADPLKSKQLDKGVQQLTEEGVAQLFVQHNGNRKIIGTVGELQFEVIQYRLKHEYGASCNFQHLNVYKACWVTFDDKEEFEKFARFRGHQLAMDKDGNYVFLAESSWMLNTIIQDFPKLHFHFNSEFKTA